MSRSVAGLPAGSRLSDYISLGAVAKAVPLEAVRSALSETGRESERVRDLPAHVMVYYVIALALYMQVSYREVLRCLLEGVRWLAGPGTNITPACKSAISQARIRLGEAPLRRLFETVCHPIATAATAATAATPGSTPGSYYRGWRLVSLDGTTLDVPDTRSNADYFGRASAAHGETAFPQLRLVGLMETGTHVVFAASLGPYTTSEMRLSRSVIPHLERGMLCVADRLFTNFDLFELAASTGAELLWRIRKDARLPITERLSDGSYLSEIRPSWRPRQRGKQKGKQKGKQRERGARDRRCSCIRLRVIEYKLPLVRRAEPLYRLVTTILDPHAAPASELAALYHERWEMEGAFDELKTHLRGGSQVVLRSKTPELVRQEVYGLLLAHYAVRGLMHEAALGDPSGARDPDTLSFTHAVRVVRRSLPRFAAISPSGPATGVATPAR
jgi:hypothetical protein